MSNDKSNTNKNQTAKNSKVYLKTLALEHGENVSTYIVSMETYDQWLESKLKCSIKTLKRKPLKAWQVTLLRELNPTEFEIETMKDEGRFEKWFEWFSEIRNFANNNNP